MGEYRLTGGVRIQGLRPQTEKKIREESDEFNESISNYCQKRLRAGLRLFDCEGRINSEIIEKLIDGDVNKFDNSSESNTPSTLEFESEIASTIESNLSTENPTPLRSDEEQDIIDIVVKQVIKDALAELMEENKVKNVPGEGYVRK